MPDYTTNFNLKKPRPSEFYDVADFNGNADIIDTELKKVTDKVGGQLVKPSTTTENNVPVFASDGQLKDSGVKLADKANTAKQAILTLFAANWSNGTYQVESSLLAGSNPPGDIGPAVGATAAQVLAWAAAVPSIVNAGGGVLVLRANGSTPGIDLNVLLEVRS